MKRISKIVEETKKKPMNSEYDAILKQTNDFFKQSSPNLYQSDGLAKEEKRDLQAELKAAEEGLKKKMADNEKACQEFAELERAKDEDSERLSKIREYEVKLRQLASEYNKEYMEYYNQGYQRVRYSEKVQREALTEHMKIGQLKLENAIKIVKRDHQKVLDREEELLEEKKKEILAKYGKKVDVLKAEYQIDQDQKAGKQT